MNKEQRLKAISQAEKKIHSIGSFKAKYYKIATQKELDQWADLIIQSESVESGKIESFDELDFN